MKNRMVYSHAGRSRRPRASRAAVMSAIACLGVLLAAGGSVAALRASQLQIHRIAVTGLQALDERAVRARIDGTLAGTRWLVFPRRSFPIADTDAVEADLARDFPRIRVVSATKKFPDMLNVSVVERVFWGVFCTGNAAQECAYIDPDGVAYERAPRPRGSLIISIQSDSGEDIVPGAQAIDPGLMRQIRALEQGIAAQTNITPADFELRARAPDEIRAVSADGMTMIFVRQDDYAPVLKILKRVLEGEIKERRERLDYIDLRFDNKVFYKMK
jgi:cell division septal protein FtsQ